MAKKSALTLGIIMIIVGIWSFIQYPVLGVFGIDATLGVIHIILGIILAGVALWATEKSAVTLKTIGIILVIVAIWGFISSPVLGFINVDTADNWLHLILGIVAAGLGFSAKNSMSSAPMQA